jgi:glucose-1-phosphatase
MGTVKNVIFDLGGVIMDLHFDRTHEAFTKLGATDFYQLYTLAKQTTLIDDFETGKISAAAFRDGLRKSLQIDADDSAIDAAWSAMLGEIPVGRIDYIKSLRPKYRTYLLSNTNAIHIVHVNDYLKRAHRHDDLGLFFDKAHYSYELGHRKPTPESFRAVLAANNLQAHESLFVDDLAPNIAAARAVGLQAVQVPLGADLRALLKLS